MLAKFRLGPVVLLAAVVVALAVLLKLDEWAWDAFFGEWWHRFERSAEPWVAIGTILLAFGTFMLAHRSRQEVSAVAEQTAASLQEVELSRRALQAAARPLLVDAPVGVFVSRVAPLFRGPSSQEQYEDRARITVEAGSYFDQQDDEAVGYAHCKIPMQNVGSGAALITGFDFKWFPGTWRRSVLQTVVPPSQLTRFDFSRYDLDPGEGDAMSHDLDQGTPERMEVEVSYTDMDGDQLTRTRLVIEHAWSNSRVTEVLLYNGSEAEAFAKLVKEIRTPQPRKEPDTYRQAP